MRGVLVALGGVPGMVLAGALVAVTLVVVGLGPMLGALTGAVVAVDLRYYRHHVDGDHDGNRPNPAG